MSRQLLLRNMNLINEMPNSTNGVGVSKWLSKEIIESDKCIDNLEEKHVFFWMRTMRV